MLLAGATMPTVSPGSRAGGLTRELGGMGGMKSNPKAKILRGRSIAPVHAETLRPASAPFAFLQERARAREIPPFRRRSQQLLLRTNRSRTTASPRLRVHKTE